MLMTWDGTKAGVRGSRGEFGEEEGWGGGTE